MRVKSLGADRRDIPVVEKWEEVKKILRESPSPEAFEEMLGVVGLNMERFWAMYGKEKKGCVNERT